MNIDPNSFISGYPALEVRKVMKYFSHQSFSTKSVQTYLELSTSEADKFVSNMLQEGYLEATSEGSKNLPLHLTVKGNALANASAAKPILRKTAERNLENFLGRVKDVNQDTYWLFGVPEVRLFGSMLSDKARVSDVDLAFDLVLKPEYITNHKEKMDERIDEAIDQGRSFSSFLDQIAWPQTEVYRFLKSKSRSLSFCFLSEPERLDVEYRVIYLEK